ncbi:MAG TPA: hypothetical protein VF169_06925 [Albitalea sp.]|uniref:hypothetical protein n=1 Tax=Piscinibacter sp. TaxID=1903157 RepID=UPI002ED3037F
MGARRCAAVASLVWWVAAIAGCGGGGGSGDASGSAPVPAPGPPPPPSIAISDLQPGQWSELPGTTIRSVLPNPPQPGYPPNLVLSWSGGTVDAVRSRLLVWGGGHADYSGNEVYALDLPSLSMQRAIEPSPLTAQSHCTSALPDGSPTARHTYDGLAHVAHTDQFFSVGGALAPCGTGDGATWTYDFAARSWRIAVADSPMKTRYGTMAVYDAATRLVYVKDQVDFHSYSPATGAYTRLNRADQPVDYHLSAAIDSRRRKFVMIGDGVQVIDLNTLEMTTMATRQAPAFVGSQQSPGIGYDPVADRIVAWHGGREVYALDMDTGVWTQVATNAGPAASAPVHGTFGRWGYVPAYRVFALVNDIDQNAWVFRLGK